LGGLVISEAFRMFHAGIKVG